MDVASLAGVQASSNQAQVQSPETYVGFARAQHFGSPSGLMPNQSVTYAAPPNLALNQWALSGTWTDTPEHAMLDKPGGVVAYHFYARDLHLVLGPGTDGRPVRFQVQLDGKAPAADHGVDTDADGNGTVHEQRLYQLIRQSGDVREHEFSIRFLDAGVTVYAFTFG
jgi:hypothetical protein